LEGSAVFVQIRDAKVKLTGIRDIKNYLLEKVPVYNGYPVVHFTSFGQEVFVHFVNELRGRPQKKFFGYIEDVAINIQKGFYEENDLDGIIDTGQ